MPGTHDLLHDDDLAVIDDSHLAALDWMLLQPSRYAQRIVEHVCFLAKGAQRWRRTMQVRLPPIHRDASQTQASPSDQSGRQPFVVSLGMYRRRRFPDFEVRNCHGDKLNLLTRQQHGYCNAHGILHQFLLDDEWDAVSDASEGSELAHRVDRLFVHLQAMLKSVVPANDPEPDVVEDELKAVLRTLGATEQRVSDAAALFEESYRLMTTQTQYLCWVVGRPGETIQLEITYTVTDEPSLSGPVQPEPQIGQGAVLTRASGLVKRQWWRWRNWRRKWYAAFGLVPLHYYFHAPSHDHAGSYYFTFAPPDNVDVALMDWGRGRCFERSSNGIDSAHHTCHIHNGEDVRDRSSIFASHISVFVRAAPSDHGKLAGVAVLSLCLAWLAQNGGLVQEAGSPPSHWLLLAPAAIVVFISVQRQHHYGTLMRPLRLVMWAYVAMLILFAGSVSFDPFKRDEWLGRANALDDVASGALALASVALLITLLASSTHYDKVAQRRFTRMFERSRVLPGVWSRARRWYCHPWGWPLPWEAEQRLADRPDDGTRSYDTANMYAHVARQYVDRRLTEASVVLVCAATLGLSVGGGWGSGRAAQAQIPPSAMTVCAPGVPAPCVVRPPSAAVTP